MKTKEKPVLENNFPIDYRYDVANQIVEYILKCESFSLVGMEDNSKANLIRFISLRYDVQKYYLKKEYNDYLFVIVDLNDLMEISIKGFYQLFGLTLINQLKSEGKGFNYLKNIFTQDSGVLFQNIKTDIQQIVESLDKKIVFVFNDFDILNDANLQQLARNLVSIRNSARYKISYIFVCTRPININQFFFNKVIWMKPFSGKDAMDLVHRNIVRYDISISNEKEKQIIELSGGHAGMIKFIVQALARNNDLNLESSILLKEGDLAFQCERILMPITDIERAKLKSGIKDTVLINLGLQVEKKNGIEIFSPILREYLNNKPELIKPFCYDNELDEIYLYGNPIKYQLSFKEILLLKLLIYEPTRVFSKVELMEKLWGNDSYPSDWAFDKFISRLREKLDLTNSNHLLTKRNVGITLSK